jgi:hypothetical protein
LLIHSSISLSIKAIEREPIFYSSRESLLTHKAI